MNDSAARHTAHEALAVISRVRLLDALRASKRALDARELAEACGLHVSTVRFHLEILAAAGLVRSQSEPAHRRGRPRLLYTPASAGAPSAPEPAARHRSRRALGGHPGRAGTARRTRSLCGARFRARARPRGRAAAQLKEVATPFTWLGRVLAISVLEASRCTAES